MRLSIAHHTRYRFTAPQARLVQLLRLRPGDDDRQSVAAWRIDVDCDARLREGRDGFGNIVTMLYAAGPLDDIEISVTGEVLTRAGGEGRVGGATETLPPAVYLRQTALSDPGKALAALGSRSGDARAVGIAVAEALAAGKRCRPGRGDPGRSAREAFDTEIATPRDMAHMLIGAVRAAAIPARYVSGHHLPDRDEARAPTAHGWTEIFDGQDWIGIDACAGAPVDDSYVRVAVGLDYSHAAPVAGSRLGFGEERLDVDVRVEPVAPGD